MKGEPEAGGRRPEPGGGRPAGRGRGAAARGGWRLVPEPMAPARPRGWSGSKRSRAAEVYNLSEKVVAGLAVMNCSSASLCSPSAAVQVLIVACFFVCLVGFVCRGGGAGSTRR